MRILHKYTKGYTDSLGATHFIADIVRKIDNQRLYHCWIYTLEGETHIHKTNVFPSQFFSLENAGKAVGELDDYLNKHNLIIVSVTES